MVKVKGYLEKVCEHILLLLLLMMFIFLSMGLAFLSFKDNLQNFQERHMQENEPKDLTKEIFNERHWVLLLFTLSVQWFNHFG